MHKMREVCAWSSLTKAWDKPCVNNQALRERKTYAGSSSDHDYRNTSIAARLPINRATTRPPASTPPNWLHGSLYIARTPIF